MKNKILIIDDDRDFVDILRHNLEKKGYEVACAYDGRTGIEKTRNQQPDLIILDVMLPELDGFKVSRLLKFDMKYKHIPIVMFSLRRGDSVTLSSEVGADAYITKSADMDELLDKIESILKGKPPTAIETAYPTIPAPAESDWIKDASIDELRLKIKRLTAINEVVYDMNRSFEIDVCIKQFIEKISNILSAEVSSLMLLDKKRGELVMRISKGIKEEVIRGVRAKLGEGVAGLVAKEGKPILMEDIKKHPHLKAKSERSYKTNSFISVPLVVDEEVLGVVNVTDKLDRTNFTKEDLDMLVSIARSAAVSIKNSASYEELRRINKVRTDSLAIISHELKLPLVNILGSIDILLKDSSDDLKKDQVKFLEIAKNNIERLTRLLDDLLDFSKLESGVIVLKRDRFSVSDLIRDVASTFKSSLKEKSVSLILNVPPDEKTIWGDPDRIEQVLDNLLNNAVKFAPPKKGRIEILLEDIGDNIRIVISDNGPGIPDEIMPRIFDRFSSIYVEKDKVRQGTGLGLSIAKDIVTMHKGSIWAESDVGKGSKFFVELPKDLRRKE